MIPAPPEGAVVLGRGKTFQTNGPFDGWALDSKGGGWMEDQYLGTDPNITYAAKENSVVALLNSNLVLQAAPEEIKIKSVPVCQHGKSITEWCDVCDPKDEQKQEVESRCEKQDEPQFSNLAEFLESTQHKNNEEEKKPCCDHSVKQTPIPASKLLKAESARLDILKHAMPDGVQGFIDSQIWAYNLAAAFLESLGAPEKIQGYFPAEKNEH